MYVRCSGVELGGGKERSFQVPSCIALALGTRQDQARTGAVTVAPSKRPGLDWGSLGRKGRLPAPHWGRRTATRLEKRKPVPTITLGTPGHHVPKGTLHFPLELETTSRRTPGGSQTCCTALHYHHIAISQLLQQNSSNAVRAFIRSYSTASTITRTLSCSSRRDRLCDPTPRLVMDSS